MKEKIAVIKDLSKQRVKLYSTSESWSTDFEVTRNNTWVYTANNLFNVHNPFNITLKSFRVTINYNFFYLFRFNLKMSLA